MTLNLKVVQKKIPYVTLGNFSYIKFCIKVFTPYMRILVSRLSSPKIDEINHWAENIEIKLNQCKKRLRCNKSYIKPSLTLKISESILYCNE